jgi:hypothetical protein
MVTAKRRKITKNRLRVLVTRGGVTRDDQLKRGALLHIGLITYDVDGIEVLCGRDLGPTYHVPFHWFFWQNASFVCRRCRDQLMRRFPEARERAQPTPFRVLPAGAAGRAELHDEG